jgi:hypothetical protein
MIAPLFQFIPDMMNTNLRVYLVVLLHYAIVVVPTTTIRTIVVVVAVVGVMLFPIRSSIRWSYGVMMVIARNR